MRSIFSALFFFLSSVHLYSSEFAVTRINVEFSEDFNGFSGTMGTLPVGWFVSTNGFTTLVTSNDFRGVHSGCVTAGGCYAWSVGNNAGGINHALGMQPTADIFTPGFLMVVVSNATKSAIKEISFSYDVVCLNNADRSSCLDLELSIGGGAFAKVDELAFVSPQLHGENSTWCCSSRSCRVGLPSPVKAGQCIWLRWYGDDVCGSGSRDEYGIDNFRVVFHYIGGTVITIR